jgi:zinc transport system substrate-binding protein
MRSTFPSLWPLPAGRHRPRARGLAGAALAVLLLALAPLPAQAEALRVFVSVLPLQTFAERVGGERVAVRTMVRPGYSPATYDPTPQQIAALARADLYVRVGAPFEDAWMPRIRGANPEMKVVDAREGIDLRPMAAHVHHDDHHPHHGDGGEQMDSHVWTSPVLARRMAATIRDALKALDPEHGAAYDAGYRAFAAELTALDRELAGILEGQQGARFMVFHPAWGYFADRYGLEQVPIEHQGKEPGARALARLIDQARASGIRVVFVQPQFNRRSAERVAQAIDGRVEAIDPLAPDYGDNLRRVARLIAGEAGR